MYVSGRNIKMIASVPDFRIRIAAVYTKRQFEISASNRIATVGLGSMYSGEERDVLFRLEIVHDDDNDELSMINLLNVTVTYYQETHQRRRVSGTCVIRKGLGDGIDHASSVSNRTVSNEMCRWIVASALECILLNMRGNEHRRRRGPRVSEILLSAIEELKRISVKAGGLNIESHIRNLLRFYPRFYKSGTRKMLSSATQKAFQQRSLSATSSCMISEWQKRRSHKKQLIIVGSNTTSQ